MNLNNLPRKVLFHTRRMFLSSLIISRSYHLLSPMLSGIGSIFMFHRIVPQSSGPRIKAVSCLEASMKYLENLVKFLKVNNYDVVSIDDLTTILNEQKKPQKKVVVLSFDDGYIDNYVHAYPLLKKHNLPFTVYLTTNFPNKKAILWWYVLEGLVLNNTRISFKYEDQSFDYDCSTPELKTPTYLAIRHWIVAANSREEQELRVRALYEPYEVALYDSVNELAMTWDHIKLLADDPLITIGAHTVSHSAMSSLTASEVKNEMTVSQTLIQDQIKQEVKHFSFPFGSRAEAGIRDFKIAEQCGFLSAVTTRNANIFMQHGKHLHSLPRILIDDDQSFDNLKLNLSGVIPFMSFSKKFVTE